MRQTRSVCCSGKTSGEALSYIILTKLASYGLDIQLMRGQRYDGVGAISGYMSGVAARIQSEFPKAVYVHCFPLKLNFVIMIAKSCEVVALRNAFRDISKVAMYFSNSPKRQAAFAEKINHSEQLAE